MVADPSADRYGIESAERTAAALLRAAEAVTTSGERRRAHRLGRLLEEPDGRAMLFALTDEVLRTPQSERAMAQLRALVDRGLPKALGPLDRLGLRSAALASRAASRPVAAVVRRRIRAETTGVIVPADDPGFSKHLRERREAGFRTNVNLLGEAILGDGEAERRLNQVIARIRRPDVDYVSIKISALCANLDVIAFDSEVDRIAERLATLYREAAGQVPPVFVNLDMEEYHDLDLTVAAFRRVLDSDEFAALRAGIVLQAYLPDTHQVLEDLLVWAAERHGRGGGRIKIRLVKGANLAMESVAAELAGWPAAPYGTKAEVDASYKAALGALIAAAEEGHVEVGVASHNLFDVGWALHQRGTGETADLVGIEMLEGMAPPQARATREKVGDLVLYTPVVNEADFAASISYLARRLDENSGPENFLRSLFRLEVGSSPWKRELARFEQAVGDRHSVSTETRRTHDRTSEQRRFPLDQPFANEPDTDFTRPSNRRWIEDHLDRDRPVDPGPPIDSPAGIDALVARARTGAERWSGTAPDERRAVLLRVAERMAAERGRLLSVMAHEAAKTVREGDAEVSEAIDFAQWAAGGIGDIEELATDGIVIEPRGVVLVAGPWNFPLAIPTNGVVGALATGNAVLLKPAPETVACGAEIVRLCHEAGVPTDVVQLVRCPDDDTGRHLVTHDDVDLVLLTGAHETAQMFLDWEPRLALLAETSGKNSLIISQTADVDLALKDLVRSAFGHAGQKCSAASLAIVEAPLYDSPVFQERLRDAAASLPVGPALDLRTTMGPLIDVPGDKLRRALTQLDENEWWLLAPGSVEGDDRLWSPGVRMGVQAGSWFHQHECFGPVLGVMRAECHDHAIELQNDVPYGLTAGIHAVDEDEIDRWLERVEAGNLYVNRHITGAIVRRQPFGGWKRSSVGPGHKTGGPDDLLRFVTARPTGQISASAAQESYQHRWEERFGQEIDRSGLRAEANIHRYRPLGGVVVRVGTEASDVEVTSLLHAAEWCDTPVEISANPFATCSPDLVDVIEPDAALAARLGAAADAGVERLRLVGEPPGDEVWRAAHRAGIAVDTRVVTGDGRLELPCWLKEQAISQTRHRHGRLPD